MSMDVSSVRPFCKKSYSITARLQKQIKGKMMLNNIFKNVQKKNLRRGDKLINAAEAPHMDGCALASAYSRLVDKSIAVLPSWFLPQCDAYKLIRNEISLQFLQDIAANEFIRCRVKSLCWTKKKEKSAKKFSYNLSIKHINYYIWCLFFTKLKMSFCI